MSLINTTSVADSVHGKMSSRSSGYFYQSKITGKIFFRERIEDYQQNQSPRQKWNSEAFKFANTQLKQLLNDPDAKKRLSQEFEAANHVASNGNTYPTVRSWKFNSLIHDYKQAHPGPPAKKK